jgi:hypothetical protein
MASEVAHTKPPRGARPLWRRFEFCTSGQEDSLSFGSNEHGLNPIAKKEEAMISKRTTLLATIATAVGAFLIFGPMGDQALGGGEAVKLEGSWILTDQLGIGINMLEVFTPDPSGRTAAVHGHALSADAKAGGLCMFADYISDGVGEVVMTGSSSAEATMVLYSMRKVTPRDQVDCIWVASATAEFTTDTQEVTINFSIYPTWGLPGYPNPDTDGNLLPDDGAEPYACLSIPFIGERVRLMPPCEP